MKFHDDQAVPYWAVTLHKIRDAMTTMHDFRPELEQDVVDRMKLIPDEMLLVWQAHNDVRSNLAAAEIRRRYANGLIKDDPRFSPCGYCPGPECESKKGLGCRGPVGPDGESSRDHEARVNDACDSACPYGGMGPDCVGEKK